MKPNQTVNLYYRGVIRRQNHLNNLILGFFITIASLPRFVLEVFVRKNFGERYFTLPTALMVFLILAMLPLLPFFGQFAFPSPYHQPQYYPSDPFADNKGWYIFSCCFLFVSIIRAFEIRRSRSVFDFGTFTLSSGEIHPWFWKIKLFGKTPSIRTIETILEPLFFLIVAAILWEFDQQGVAILITICSVCYSLGYIAVYDQGDNFIMDMIDERICSEELVNSYVNGQKPSETRGVHYRGRKPADPEFRRQVADSFIGVEDVVEVL